VTDPAFASHPDQRSAGKTGSALGRYEHGSSSDGASDVWLPSGRLDEAMSYSNARITELMNCSKRMLGSPVLADGKGTICTRLRKALGNCESSRKQADREPDEQSDRLGTRSRAKGVTGALPQGKGAKTSKPHDA